METKTCNIYVRNGGRFMLDMTNYKHEMMLID